MANSTKCQTPDVVFGTAITSARIVVDIELPFPLCIDEQEAELLETNIHNALELVLSKYFYK